MSDTLSVISQAVLHALAFSAIAVAVWQGVKSTLGQAGLKLPRWANVLLPRAVNLGCYVAVLVLSGYPPAVVALGAAVAAFAPGAVYDTLKAARAADQGG